MATLKEYSKRPLRLTGGHRLCSGCAATMAVRQILASTPYDVVVGLATGCLEVGTTIYPYTAWNVPYIHCAFENVAATISGVEAAYKAFKRQGKIPPDKEIKFVAFGGDGGTYDIGLQSLSGALERGHNFVYVCYDNEAYMNTGIQRSGATPQGAETTTCPAGKSEKKKDLTEIVASHHIPYVAQASIGLWQDLMRKAEKAFEVNGPAFLLVSSPCHRGWRYPEAQTVKIAKLLVDTCMWPLYEIENGVFRLTYKPRKKKPIIEMLKAQGRFKHLLKPENAHIIEEMQREVDKRWESYLKREAFCAENL